MIYFWLFLRFIALLFAIFLYIVGLTFLFPIFFGIISPVPSMPQIKKLLIQKIKQYDNSNSPIIDIGSGYGSMIFYLAKAFPHRTIIACDLSSIPLLTTKFIAKIFKIKNLKFVHQNGFDYVRDNPEISSIFFYLPITKRTLRDLHKLDNHFHGYLFANTYPHPELEIIEALPAHDLFKSTLYIHHLK